MSKPKEHVNPGYMIRLIREALEKAVEKKELPQFLETFLTKSDQTVLLQRLLIAYLLRSGFSFRGIRDRTGAAFNTITSVDQSLRKFNPHYRRLFPLRHHPQKRVPHHQYADTHHGLPGSIKDFYRGMAGADLW